MRFLQHSLNPRRARYCLALMVVTVLVSTPSIADVLPGGYPETDWGRQAIERFHDFYDREQFQRIYAEYDSEYTAAIPPQKHLAMFRRARNDLGRSISATSIQSKSETRHGEQVFIVTELATFECGRTIPEEFIFKPGSPVGKLLAYIF
jgi:hypothetical protein